MIQKREMQKALRGTGVVQRTGSRFDCEGAGRTSPPALGWHDLVIQQKFTTDEALGKTKDRVARARDPLVAPDTKDTD